MKVLILVVAFNEYTKIDKVLKDLEELIQSDSQYDVLIVDDGSTDNSQDIYNQYDFKLIKHSKNFGVGYSMKVAIKYAMQNSYDTVVTMAGNGKMLAKEIPILTKPLEKGYNYVQGSRYLNGFRSPNLPKFRKIAIQILTKIINLITGFDGTDLTCGFRAYKLDIFKHKDINIYQDWLDKYELEYYIHYKVIKLGFKIKEVEVSMNYPKIGKNYSKIKPFIGWWSMLRPWIFLFFKIKR